MLNSVTMVAIRVMNWQSMLEWYTTVLGFQPLAVETDDQFAMLGLPGGGAHLALVGGYDVQTEWLSRCMPNVLVNDLDDTMATLRSRGVEFEDNLHGADEGYRLVSFHDPEGNALQLFEWIRSGKPY